MLHANNIDNNRNDALIIMPTALLQPSCPVTPVTSHFHIVVCDALCHIIQVMQYLSLFA